MGCRLRMHPLNRAHLALVVATGLAGSSCSLFTASEAVVYSLNRVNGQPLPATAFVLNIQGGGSMEYQVLRGTLSLVGLNRFEMQTNTRRVWNGIPNDSVLGGRRSGLTD